MTWIQRYEYVKKHYPLAGWFLAVLFAYGYVTKKPEQLTMPAPLVVNQAQEVKYVDKVRTVTKIVPQYIEVPGEAPRALPCPSIEVISEAGSESVHWQSQAVTVAPKTAPDASRLALFAGGGYVAQPVLTLGLGYDRLRIQGLAGLGVYGGLVTWDVLK